MPILNLKEDATTSAQQQHQRTLLWLADDPERRSLEEYDYSHFNEDTFKFWAKQRFTDREYQIFFGEPTSLFGAHPVTPEALAATLGISRQGVYGIKHNAYKKLKYVWNFIFAPTPWDGSYKDSDPLGSLPLSSPTRLYLRRRGLDTVGDFKSIDEAFLEKHFASRPNGKSEILEVLRILRT